MPERIYRLSEAAKRLDHLIILPLENMLNNTSKGVLTRLMMTTITVNHQMISRFLVVYLAMEKLYQYYQGYVC